MITLRIPTKEQYAYVEIQVDSNIDEAMKIYNEAITKINKTSSISDFDFNNYLIKLVNSDLTEWGHTEFYQELNESQKMVVQSLKRFSKRLLTNEE